MAYPPEFRAKASIFITSSSRPINSSRAKPDELKRRSYAKLYAWRTIGYLKKLALSKPADNGSKGPEIGNEQVD